MPPLGGFGFRYFLQMAVWQAKRAKPSSTPPNKPDIRGELVRQAHMSSHLAVEGYHREARAERVHSDVAAAIHRHAVDQLEPRHIRLGKLNRTTALHY